MKKPIERKLDLVKSMIREIKNKEPNMSEMSNRTIQYIVCEKMNFINMHIHIFSDDDIIGLDYFIDEMIAKRKSDLHDTVHKIEEEIRNLKQ